ncbi:MAG: TerY-C metal binding domain-containing protein [Streptococcus sp.]
MEKELPRSSGGAGNAVAVKLDSVRTGPQYKCPHCGQKYTFKCWNCGKSTCYDGDDHDGREVVCAHCGESGVFRTVSAVVAVEKQKMYMAMALMVRNNAI